MTTLYIKGILENEAAVADFAHGSENYNILSQENNTRQTDSFRMAYRMTVQSSLEASSGVARFLVSDDKVLTFSAMPQCFLLVQAAEHHPRELLFPLT